MEKKLRLFRAPARYNPYSTLNIRYNIKVVLCTKIFACVAPIILEKRYAMLISDEMNMKIETGKVRMCLTFPRTLLS